jgi:hypothetical protein
LVPCSSVTWRRCLACRGRRVEQVAQHPVVGLDWLAFPPAGNQSGALVQGGLYQMRHAGLAGGKLPALKANVAPASSA